MNSEARRSCHGWIVDLSFRTSRPEGERQGSIHGARKSQNRMVSPPRMISPDCRYEDTGPGDLYTLGCLRHTHGLERYLSSSAPRVSAFSVRTYLVCDDDSICLGGRY